MTDKTEILKKILDYQERLDLSKKAMEVFKKDIAHLDKDSEGYLEGIELLWSSMNILSEHYAALAICKAKYGVVGKELKK